MLPFIVTAPGLRHLILQGETDSHGFPLARLRDKWQSLLDARPPTKLSKLESITIPGAGTRESILFKVAAVGLGIFLIFGRSRLDAFMIRWIG